MSLVSTSLIKAVYPSPSLPLTGITHPVKPFGLHCYPAGRYKEQQLAARGTALITFITNSWIAPYFEGAKPGQVHEVWHFWLRLLCKSDSELNVTFSLSIRKHSCVIGVVGQCDEVSLVSFIGFCDVNAPRMTFSKLHCHKGSLCVIATDASIVCRTGWQIQGCGFLEEKGNLKCIHMQLFPWQYYKLAGVSWNLAQDKWDYFRLFWKIMVKAPWHLPEKGAVSDSSTKVQLQPGCKSWLCWAAITFTAWVKNITTLILVRLGEFVYII